MDKEKITILVVDDSETHRQFLTYSLTNERYKVVESKDGLEAFNTAKKIKPDLIITDILMPVMDGYEMINKLKQDKELSSIQIILYTAEYQEKEAISLAKLFGISYYLNKPADKEKLLDTVENALNKKTNKLNNLPLEEISKKHLDLLNNKLYQQVQDLKKLKGELEDRILERTKELELLNKKLHEDSTRDPLTGLFNRRQLDIVLEREISRSNRNKESFSVAMIDIDLFKQINDKYGHHAGDIVLYTIAQFLQNSVRNPDIVCRYGGEEFIIILVNISESDTLLKLEKIRKEIKDLEIKISSNMIKFLTVSIGFAMYPKDKLNAQDLIDAADQALYSAKKSGRDCIEIYDDSKRRS